MRLWHYELIKVLPNKQLTGQWREISAIIGLVNKFKNPNSLIVNKVVDYPLSDFIKYIKIVEKEMKKRGFATIQNPYEKIKTLNEDYFNLKHYSKVILKNSIFKFWHTNRYLFQCIFNLQEKYDCGGISEQDWKRIKKFANKKLRNSEFKLIEI